MRKSSRRLLKWDGAVILGALELLVVAAMSTTLAMAAPPRPPRLADITGGELTAQALARLTASMDPAMLSLAARFAVEAQTAGARGATPPAGLVQAAATEGEAVIGLQNLSPEAARLWNAANPVAGGPTAAARPFNLNASGVLDEQRAIDCMTAAVYYEAAMESTDGQRAVAQVVLNRMRHPAFPKSVCGVIFQGSNRKTGCQFSFTCDGSLGRAPSTAGWARAREVAVASLNGYVMKGVGNATHYHANYVAPYWSPSLHKIATVGAHIFYRWTGGWGLPPAFSGSYAGNEMNGLQVATLDGLVKTQAKLELADAPELAPAIEPEAETQHAVAEPVAVEITVAAVPAETVAKDATTVVADNVFQSNLRKPRNPARMAYP